MALLFFGYTWCPDVCPIHMANIGQAMKSIPTEDRHRVEVVFVSTDPARDTPERIREWLDVFDRSFVGLRGTLEEVNRIQNQGPPSRVTARRARRGRQLPGRARGFGAGLLRGWTGGGCAIPSGRARRRGLTDLPKAHGTVGLRPIAT